MTLPDGTHTATVDRIVESTVVLLIEERDEVIGEVTVPVNSLNDDVSEGSVLTVVVEEGNLQTVERNRDEEHSRRERLRRKFDRLSERPPDNEE